jgi:hypothetical protein
MTMMMTVWLVALGAIIYAPVKLANRDSNPSRPSRDT